MQNGVMIVYTMAEEERYSNRQIERMLENQSKDIKEHIDSATGPILEQTIKTNGRVTAVEGKVERHSHWRTGMTWGGGVLFFFMTTFIIPVLTWNLLQTLKLKEDIKAHVQAAVTESLKEYEINP